MKTEEIKVLVSTQDKQIIKDKAEKLGISMSAYLRMRGLQG